MNSEAFAEWESARYRSRVEIEADVLVALITMPLFAARALPMLRVEHFSSSVHRDLLRALCREEPDPTNVDAWIARALTMTEATARAWRMAASVQDYDADVQRILNA